MDRRDFYRFGGEPMKTIIFFGSHKSGSSKDATEAAEQLGFYTVLITDRKSFLEKRTEFPHVHEMIYVEFGNRDDVLEKISILQLQGKEINAIVSFVEPYVYHAARLGEELGLPAQTSEAILRMQDKVQTRTVFAQTKYAVPFQVVSGHPKLEKLEVNLPLVVKAPRSTGSKDVLLANGESELIDHICYLREKYPVDVTLVEEYVSGQQYLAEVLVHAGRPHVVAVLQQDLTQGDRFIITDYCLLASPGESLRRTAEEMAEEITRRMGLVTGGFHVEFKIAGDRCKIIEVNPRISGTAMNRIIQYAYGINLVKETIRSLLGETPELSCRQHRYVHAHYLTMQQQGVLAKVTGRRRAMKCPLVEEVYVKPHKGALLKSPLSMGHRYAYVITAGDSAEEAKKAAVYAANFIQFQVDPVKRGKQR